MCINENPTKPTTEDTIIETGTVTVTAPQYPGTPGPMNVPESDVIHTIVTAKDQDLTI